MSRPIKLSKAEAGGPSRRPLGCRPTRRLKYSDSGVTSSYTHSTVSSGLFVGRFITTSSSIAAVTRKDINTHSTPFDSCWYITRRSKQTLLSTAHDLMSTIYTDYVRMKTAYELEISYVHPFETVVLTIT